MMDILQKAAEILVKSGIGINVMPEENAPRPTLRMSGTGMGNDYFMFQEVDPFADTLEGRRQADAIEDWLGYNQHQSWSDSKWADGCDSPVDLAEYNSSNHQWRLDRIKWCLEQLMDE